MEMTLVPKNVQTLRDNLSKYDYKIVQHCRNILFYYLYTEIKLYYSLCYGLLI